MSSISLPKREICHLHTHTEYSLLDAIKNSTEFIKAAKEKGIKEYAITEHGNLASAMGFYIEAIKPENNIKPIFGIETYFVDNTRKKKVEDAKSSHLVLIARTNVGFKNLLKISNFSWGAGFYYKPKIDFKHLKKHSKGLTALTACMGGVIANAIRFRDYDFAKQRVMKLKSIFKNNLFLEMQVMEEVYGPDLVRVEKKIKSFKDENVIKHKLEILNTDKDMYVELLERHISEKEIQSDYEDIMKNLLGDAWVDQATVNKYMMKLSKETDVPVVMTGDCHYPYKGDHNLQDFIIRVGFGDYKKAREGADDKSQSSGRGYYSKELYVKNNEDFDKSRRKWHPYMPKQTLVEAIQNTHKIADAVKTQLQIGQHQLPIFPIKDHPMYKDGDTKEIIFERLIERGFKNIVIPKISNKEIQKYRERIQYEIETIKKANFIDYFLIIEDIVRWSRNNGIFSVARGSVAGSLVAYALDITNIDPIPYNLLFERFLNPTRVSGERAKAADALPDVDLDFERFGRGRVKRYITEKYGKDRVLTIGSYGTMGVKMLLKDFARVKDYKIGDNVYDYTIINKITSEVDMGVKTIDEACYNDNFRKFYEENKDWFEKYIRPLQGEIRSFSRHAAGVLITPTKYTDWVPVRTQTIEEEDENGKLVKNRIIISQWEDTYCERRGLLKLDILGVKQLDVFHRCLDLIKQNHDLVVSLDDIDVNDKSVYKKFHVGDNFGVFQFNSSLQSHYMMRMRPNNIEDLCASNALLRPGPMQEGAHEKFIQLRNKETKPEYDHPCVLPYLESTQGLMIYQESLMQVSHVLGGLSLSEADQMRSAIKKKDPKMMMPFNEKFIKGCLGKGLSLKHSNHVWDKILAFSSYSFNKSHSATYALQGYYCQWLKTYFPNEFYAATMEFAADDVKKNENIYTHRRHAISEGITILTPEINKSTLHFDMSKKGSIYWPLRAIKGVGDKASLIINKNQPYKSFEDFMERIEKRVVNKRVMTKLIAANVFRSFGKPEEIMRQYFKLKKEDYPEQFDNLEYIHWHRLKDQTLGFVSKSYKEILKDKFSQYIITFEQFNSLKKNGRACIGGIVSKFREHKASNGKMCFMTVEDKNDTYEIVSFASVYQHIKEKPKVGNIVEIRGTKGISPRGDVQIVLGNPESDKIFIISK